MRTALRAAWGGRLFIFASALCVVVLLAGSAGAQTPEIESKRAQLERAQAQISATLQDVSRIQGSYERSQVRLTALREEIARNRREVEEASRKLAAARERVAERAEGSYKAGGVMYLDVLLSVRSFSEFAGRSRFVLRALAEDRRIVGRLRAARRDLEERQAALEERLREQRAVSAELLRKREAIERRLEEHRRAYAALDSELKEMIREEQERRAREAAEARRRAAAEAAERQAALERRAAEQRAEQPSATLRTQEEAAVAEKGPAPAETSPAPETPERTVEETGSPAARPAAPSGDGGEEAEPEVSAPPVSPSGDGDAGEEQPDVSAPAPPASEAQEQYEEPEVAVPEAPQPEEVSADPRVQAILENPNVALTEMARQDLLSGIVDPRVLDVVEFAASEHSIAISVFATGHPYGPTLDALGYAGYPNAHYFGRAVDIYAVDGAPVSSGNQAAYELAQAIYARFSPAELGSPWTFGAGSFSDALHQDHIHVGWAYAASGSL
ncbi:hypothetical protein RxyAA322_22370 [Rubrobacter xylanophilus]|uniref:Peptidase M23B n=1 Tax=Rubrobacter xylanophilus TaxID=49319 RepID=A0A510HNR5_9ACTN|nr:hypothetical protein [Rubrobacter xylanophilus]BBL80383.1 hypothetical protein RxyAA322_22370 [Rubrobacter xylanophilus]